MMKLTILIPAHNEAKNIENTVIQILRVLRKTDIHYEILIVDDNSTDSTEEVVKQMNIRYDSVGYIRNPQPKGFGHAIQTGLQNMTGDAVVIVMADGSDNPEDIVKYYQKLLEGYSCVFGSRFIWGSKLINYPLHKLLLNRAGNWFISLLFNLHYNDITNAFKCYRKEVIQDIQPLLSYHFNLTVELSLKAIVKGHNYAVIPISWINRTSGISKFKIKEIGGVYLLTILHILIEKYFKIKKI